MKRTRHRLTIGAAIMTALLPATAAAQNPPPLPPPPPPQLAVNSLPPNPNNSGGSQEPRRPPRDPSIASLMAYIEGRGLSAIVMIDDPVIAFGNEDLWVAEPEVRAVPVAPVRATTAARATSRQPRTAVTR